MNPPDAVIKLGGSLLRGGDVRPLLQVLNEEAAAGKRLLVVPGGGPFADAVRAACAAREPGETAAHWMAVLAMDQHAHLLAGLLPDAALVEGQPPFSCGTRLAIFAPYAWLRRADPLPRGWEVTSDSIAAWIAARLGAPLLVLLKSADGLVDANGEVLRRAGRAALAGTSMVDPHFARTLQPGTRCWIVNGRHPHRLRQLLRDGVTLGTEVC